MSRRSEPLLHSQPQTTELSTSMECMVSKLSEFFWLLGSLTGQIFTDHRAETIYSAQLLRSICCIFGASNWLNENREDSAGNSSMLGGSISDSTRWRTLITEPTVTTELSLRRQQAHVVVVQSRCLLNNRTKLMMWWCPPRNNEISLTRVLTAINYGL